VHTRTAELDNMKAWANVNNLRLNLAKCAEIIFYDSRRKRQPVQPPPLPNVPRVQSLKILGVTISSKLSVAEHVYNIIRSSAQTCHALPLLRAHGMTNASLQIVYRAIITAKLTYAASAWWGCTTEADRQCLEAIIRRGKHTDLCSEDHPALAEVVECADDELFDKVLISSGHVVYSILPRETVSAYAFRRRQHNRELISKTMHLAQCSFIVRILYKDMY